MCPESAHALQERFVDDGLVANSPGCGDTSGPRNHVGMQADGNRPVAFTFRLRRAPPRRTRFPGQALDGPARGLYLAGSDSPRLLERELS